MFKLHVYLHMDIEERSGVGNRLRCRVESQQRADLGSTA